VKKEKFYFVADRKVFSLPANRKKLLSLFGDRSHEIETFIVRNNLNLNTEHHLQKIFEYYNALN